MERARIVAFLFVPVKCDPIFRIHRSEDRLFLLSFAIFTLVSAPSIVIRRGRDTDGKSTYTRNGSTYRADYHLAEITDPLHVNRGGNKEEERSKKV